MNKVLLIENENTGKHYQELVQKSIENIEIVWVKSRAEALQAFEKNQFNVVVYDQRLDNNELGTDVMTELKLKDNNILGIMLSAYATPEDTTQAGKKDILFDYLNKNKVESLPVKIIDALRFYDINKVLNQKQEKKYLGKVRKKNTLFCSFKYFLISKQLINSDYIFDDSWEDLFMINAGEEQCQKKSIEISRTVKVINNLESEYGSDLSLDKIEKLVSSSFKSNVKISKNEEYIDCNKELAEIVKTFKMPQIPQSVEEDYLTTIILQGGQVYKKYDIIVSEECISCNNIKYYHFTIFVPTNQKKLRKVNTYKSGKQDIIIVSPQV